MTSRNLKANFAEETKYGAFFTGEKVQVTNDGTAALCQFGNQVKVLEIETGKVVKTFGEEDDDEITDFVLSPDDKVLVVASRTLLLKQYEWESGKCTRTWKAVHKTPISCMSFDASSTLLATGGTDAIIKVWDVIRQYCTHNFKGHDGVISCTEYHPDDDKLQLFSAADDYMIRVWDLRSSSEVAVLKGHYSIITSMLFSPDHSKLYSAARDSVVHIWDIEKFEKLKTIPVFESVESLILLPAKKYPALNITKAKCPHLITAGAKGSLGVWNTESSQCVYRQPDVTNKPTTQEMDSSAEDKEDGPSVQQISSAALIPALKSICVTTFDHNIIFYNIKNLSLNKRFFGFYDEILDVRLLGEDESQLVVASNTPNLYIFTMATWDCLMLKGHTDTVLSLDVSVKKGLIVSTSKDTTIRIWKSIETGKYECVATGRGHTQALNCAAFSKLSGKFLVSGGSDCTLKLWSLPDVWDTAGGTTGLHSQATEYAHEKEIMYVAVSPNDQLVASASQDKTAKLWRATDLSLVGVLRGHKRGIWHVQFSPVDQCLASASADGLIKIWSLSDMTCVKTFEGHDASVLRIEFIARGMQLLSTGSDGLMKLWTIKSNECVKTFEAHDDKAWALIVNNKQDRVITGGADSNIIFWKDITVEEQEEARQKQEEFIIKEQELQNLVHEKKWLKALAIAVTLDQPFRALTIIKEMLIDPGGKKNISDVLHKLRPDQLDAILKFAVRWNMNSKHCHEAQLLVRTTLEEFTAEELLELPNIKETLEGLIPYTQRHFERLNRLQQQATFVDYTWQCMKLADQKLEDDDVEMEIDADLKPG